MASQNVCRYFRFGHCKFGDTCKLLHISEICENNACEITSCNLRHPRTCKFFKEFNRCKFSEWCSFKHVENDINVNHFDTKEILEKIDNLAQIIKDRDETINQLVEKVRTLEEKINSENDTINDQDDSEIEMNKTFFNPHLPVKCVTSMQNSKTGLQVHKKAKHQNEKEISTQLNIALVLEEEKEIVVDTEIEQHLKCDECDFVSEKEQDLISHVSEKHATEKDLEIIETKLEVFAIVNFENDVLEARKVIIEQLGTQKEVVKVEKVFINKSETFFDVDNVRWNNCDIFLTTKEKAETWKNSKFRQNIFSKCFLWDNFRCFEGLNTREGLLRRKEEQMQFQMSNRGYHF